MIVTCLLLLLAAPAAASSSPEQSKAQAKDLAAQANQAYTIGRFNDALDKYTRAYEAYPAPELLFNIGQCHKNLHNYERALFFFQGFLRQKPNAPNRKLVEELIAQSEKGAELQRQAAAKRQGELAAASMQSRAFQPNAPMIEAPLYKRPWFWGVIAGSVAAAAAITTLAIVLTPAPSRPATFTVDFRP